MDAQNLVSDRQGEQNYIRNTPGLSEAPQKEETVALLASRQNRPANPQTKPAPLHIRPSSRYAPSRSEELTSAVCFKSRRTSATASQRRSQPRASRQADDIQTLDRPSATLRGLDVPEPYRSAQAQEPYCPAVSGPVERLQATEESTPLALVVQEPNEELLLTQRHSSNKCHPTEAANEVDRGLRKEGFAQNLFLEISWEGWGLIKTPDGVYLPETFNLLPHEFEDLTDQW